MTRSGQQGTGSAQAISWLNWGQDIGEPAYGAIGVISYGGGRGHVGFVVGRQGDRILLLGGNQGNQVRVSPFARDRFSAFVFPAGYEVPPWARALETSEEEHGEELSFERTR